MIGAPADDGQDGHAQGGNRRHPAVRAGPGRRSRVQGNHRGDVFFRLPMCRVELADQRNGIESHGGGDGADMAADVEVTTAGGVVVLLNAPDDGGPDPGPAADLTDAETQPATRVSQHLADAHAPPPPARIAVRAIWPTAHAEAILDHCPPGRTVLLRRVVARSRPAGKCPAAEAPDTGRGAANLFICSSGAGSPGTAVRRFLVGRGHQARYFKDGRSQRARRRA